MGTITDILLAASMAAVMPWVDWGGYLGLFQPPISYEIVSHRGLGFGAPENTVAAVKLANAAGYVAEVDIRVTSDGVPVLLHDSTLDRTTDCSGPISNTTAAVARACGVPRLDEVEDCLLEFHPYEAASLAAAVEMARQRPGVYYLWAMCADINAEHEALFRKLLCPVDTADALEAIRDRPITPVLPIKEAWRGGLLSSAKANGRGVATFTNGASQTTPPWEIYGAGFTLLEANDPKSHQRTSGGSVPRAVYESSLGYWLLAVVWLVARGRARMVAGRA